MSGNSSTSQDSFKQLSGLGASLGPPSIPEDDTSRAIKIALQLEAHGLPNLDTHGKSDPFVIVYRKIEPSDSSDTSPISSSPPTDEWHRLGTTETVYNNLNPQWATIFTLEYRFGTNSILRFVIYDRDSPDDDVTRHDFIGDVQCTVAQIVLADNQRLECPIHNIDLTASGGNAGKLIIRGEEQKGDLGETVTFQFAVSGLRRGRRPFYVLRRKNHNDAKFAPVVYSEVHQRYSRNQTIFRPITKSIARLVNSDQDRELMIEFFDYDRRGQHYRGGNVTFTLKSVRQAMSSPGGTATFVLRKRRSNGRIVDAGQVTVKKCEFTIPYSFIDYLHAGVVINTVIAVDMSNSNGDPQIPNSLHYYNPRIPNEYVVALREVGNVLAAYTTKERFMTFGFGAVLPNETETSHCFALTGDNMEPYCYGISGVIETYYQALSTVAPYEPCRYGPVLEHVIRMVREANERDYRSTYTILLIVTDGDFSDFEDVANLICGAADLPFSIVIVGVGNSDFIQLERLDGDEIRLCSSDGTPCARDIVQFVQFHKHQYNPTQLSREVLDEIPDQIVSYMRSRSIRPDDIKATQPASQQSPRKGPYYPEAGMRPSSVGSNPSSNSAITSSGPSIGASPSLSTQHTLSLSSALPSETATGAANGVPLFPSNSMTNSNAIHPTGSMASAQPFNPNALISLNSTNVHSMSPMSPANSMGHPTTMHGFPVTPNSYAYAQQRQMHQMNAFHAGSSFVHPGFTFSHAASQTSQQPYYPAQQIGQAAPNQYNSPPPSGSGSSFQWGQQQLRPRGEVD